MKDTLREAALAYAAERLAVLPCNPATKAPLTRHGHKDAMTDVDQVEAWWRRWPDALIGMATGSVSGVMVLDADSLEAVAELQILAEEAGEPLPATFTVRTHRGRHYHFKLPANTLIAGSNGKLAGRLDVKAEGGYVIMPPSPHPAGGRYEVINHSPVAPLPAWLVRRLTENRNGHGPILAAREISALRAVLLYRGYLADLRRAPEGERNTLLNLTAWFAGRVAPALPPETPDEIKAAARERGLDDREVEATFRSGWEAGRQTPLILVNSPNRTDLGNAQRLVLRHSANLRYVPHWRTWLFWDGKRWRKDETGEIQRFARETVKSIYSEAGEKSDETDRKNLARWAASSEFETRLRALVSLAQAEPGIPVTPAELDTEPFLLNCLNGTLDLQAGKLREHRREDLITKLVPVEYDPQARCPRFERFLSEIMGGKAHMVAYCQRLFGYCLTGSTRERSFYLFHGSGDNGKTTLIEIMKLVLGEYAGTAEFATFLEQRTERVRDDFADLAGARLVSGVEVPANRQLAEALLKQLTGGEDQIKARHLYSKYFKYKPQYKIVLVGNHKPMIRGTDNAIWNRVHLIPFEVVIPKKRQDRELLSKLRPESPGILAFAVQGCLGWQQRGLDPPQEVLAATAAYREEMDTLGAFLAECCVLDPNAQVTVGGLYEIYVGWCGSSYRLSRQSFGRQLKSRGFTQGRRHKGGNRYWIGLGLLAEAKTLSLSERRGDADEI